MVFNPTSEREEAASEGWVGGEKHCGELQEFNQCRFCVVETCASYLTNSECQTRAKSAAIQKRKDSGSLSDVGDSADFAFLLIEKYACPL